jgi:hypothetical protein
VGRERSRWYETKEFKSATDELGFSITNDPVHVHDLNATILQVLGFDHTKISFVIKVETIDSLMSMVRLSKTF